MESAGRVEEGGFFHRANAFSRRFHIRFKRFEESVESDTETPPTLRISHRKKRGLLYQATSKAYD